MTKEELQVVVNVLKEHVDNNEEYIERQGLSKGEIDDIRNESSICARFVLELEEKINATKWWWN